MSKHQIIALFVFAQVFVHHAYAGECSGSSCKGGQPDSTGLLQVSYAKSVSNKTVPFRFAKVSRIAEVGGRIPFPLTPDFASSLKQAGTDAVSMRVLEEDPQCHRAFGSESKSTMDKILKTVLDNERKYKCTFPDDTKRDGRDFWKEFKEVITMREHARQPVTSLFPIHPIFGLPMTSKYDDAAELVRADFPTHYPTELIKYWAGSDDHDHELIFNENVLGGECVHGNNEFVNGLVALSGLVGWAVSTVSPGAFGAKWYEGRPRPEEVAWAITSESLTPAQDIEARIKAMNLAQASDFTSYPEGSPKHPSWPAMHSAASVCSTWLPVVLNLTQKQLDEAKLVDYSVAYFRTVAGVHYPSDNLAGLTIGQHIVQKHLPLYLAETYSCSADSKTKIEEYAKARLEEFGFKWSNYTVPDTAP